jgi:AraC family transcriptional regulator of adaptative response/methylated-DNA-[protein]-cysteine methyltransferase
LASYEQVARAIELPRASRAVGTAIGANPVAVLIPCHRVIRKAGELGDYRWGLTRKRALIAREAAARDASTRSALSTP